MTSITKLETGITRLFHIFLGEAPDGTKYLTTYRCEDADLELECDADATLQIIRANYGRFSIAICNKHGMTDWSVNCMGPKTLRVMKAR